MMEALKKFSSSSLFLPLVALAVLILFNVVFVDDFLTIQMTEDGRLYGRLVDILTRSSSLIILALGMTFVIATSGIDISVGAVVAISAAVVCMLIGGRGDGVPEHSMLLAMLAAVGVFGTGSAWPDLAVALFMGGLALSGGFAVIRHARREIASVTNAPRPPAADPLAHHGRDLDRVA